MNTTLKRILMYLLSNTSFWELIRCTSTDNDHHVTAFIQNIDYTFLANTQMDIAHKIINLSTVVQSNTTQHSTYICIFESWCFKTWRITTYEKDNYLNKYVYPHKNMLIPYRLGNILPPNIHNEHAWYMLQQLTFTPTTSAKFTKNHCFPLLQIGHHHRNFHFGNSLRRVKFFNVWVAWL